MNDHGSARRTARTASRARLTSRACAFVLGALASMANAPVAAGTDATIVGQAMVVTSAPSQLESTRSVTVTAQESPTDVAALADPRIGGATITVVVTGATPSAQSFTLDAAGWTAVPEGYRYRMAKNAAGPPVRKVTLTVKPGGAAKMRAVLRGDTGTLPLLVVPPDPGTEGGVALAIGGDRYCTRFGGPAGGTIRSDKATRWRIVQPLAEAGCLDPPPPPVCGNGTVEGDETCDGNASPACEAFLGSGAECGAPDSALACSCCYPSGSEYTDVSGAGGLCCDGQEVPVAPYNRYCGSCLPDGYHCLFGPSSCCSGTCFNADGLPFPVCGSCFESGTPCIAAFPQLCCSGSCGANGLCD